ncbi:phosphonate transport system substrate-binding protein [Oikeobacillus pervagus]|uniref:Phosphonate transport system substrate-binding protein n=1 Tax=Oikeobacillus pervagus TaxID=1325931 RepID=A0AAJ1T5E9_9BACI|nr:phosphate/phosphite/phosphonate ABC transporter substrate-binding protein [Oikeobacillus pervagus]MDQ0215150.1 phosphonate transport system substrate-binding protein [Oikeobacillus pervagus]
MKKCLRMGILFLVLSLAVLTACSKEEGKTGASKAGAKGDQTELEELVVQFVPSQQADTLEAKAKPLEKLLSDQLGIPVKVSVSTDYNTIVEAMKSNKVDIGFLPPTAYVIAKEQEAADILLQAQRYGVNDDGTPTDELVDSYKSIFVVRADSGIKSIEDLKGKKIGYQNVTSSAGFVWPAATLMEAGIHPLDDMKPVTLKGHDQAIISLLNGDIDVAVTFQDARNIVAKDYKTVFKDTKIIKFTEPIPNDTITVRPEISDDMKEKIKEAFIAIGQDEKGQSIIRDIYSHEGYVASKDSNFDIVREYEKKVSKEVN